jgi:hypothetical protein
MVDGEKLSNAVPAERKALQALTGITTTTRLGLCAMSDYVALQATLAALIGCCPI